MRLLRKKVLLLVILGIIQSCNTGKSKMITQTVEHNSEIISADIIIYGGTSSGIAAAVQATRMGKKAIIIEPTSHLGGLTTGGLGQTDIGNKQAIGGISREFYEAIAREYEKPDTWNWQSKSDYDKVPKQLIGHSETESGTDKGKKAMWTFEPKVAASVFRNFIDDNNITVVKNERLDLQNGVTKKGTQIRSIRMESGREYIGRVFIDATYEGDLMAKSGVSYTIGRESEDKYGESLNGTRAKLSFDHRFPDGIDPYIVKGDPSSGLLPGINPSIANEGTGDNRVQAYCFRMTLTDIKENMIPVEKPEGYNELEYELLLRCIKAGNKGLIFDFTAARYENSFFKFAMMPNRKTDSNNEGPVSTDYIGRNYAYPDGDYETRDSILKAHEIYQKGLVWTLCNHPRIPEEIRKEYSRWGLPKDEFTDNGHWPLQIYIREARRMVSDFVMTQYHCTQDSAVDMSIGLGAYTIDSHNVQRYLTEEGFVQNEGDVQVGGFGPYPISYRAIVPKRSECTNLLVPVCLSASHIAFGSIRMEPVLMILAQSAVTAACISIDKQQAVQDISYDLLRQRLITDQQILAPNLK